MSPSSTVIPPTHHTADADALRHRMVDEIAATGLPGGAALPADVAAAMRRVPRHLFLPDTPLTDAHNPHNAVVTKRDADGLAVSSVSAPNIVALMLSQLQARPGHRVLEIGSGGYGAAVVADLVGPTGQVTTVDIDPDVVVRAHMGLAASGHHTVTALLGDGEYGVPQFAPYDRIILTHEAPDVSAYLRRQLAPTGRLVVPLRMKGLTRSVAFEQSEAHLVGREYELCGFVPMRGVGAVDERRIALLGDRVRLRVDDDRPLDAVALAAAVSTPAVQAWSGVTVARMERFDGLHLWLAIGLSEFCLLDTTQDAVDAGIVASTWPIGIPAIVEPDSVAYLTLRPTSPHRQRFEFGGIGHGPAASVLLARLVERIRTWDGTSLSARIDVHPAATPDICLPAGAWVLGRRHSRITVCWP